ncbi:MAG: hypothetical protein J6R82_05925 [Clostridia bacterium]|nr:hypothetical protein [Clostridia bacterium]
MEKIKKWFENFWYHYKWHTIVTLFFVTVIAIGVYQMAAKEEYDTQIIYAGPVLLMGEDQIEGINAAFKAIVPEDYNEDGKKTIQIHDFTILSDEQYAEKVEEAGGSVAFDPSTRRSYISNIMTLYSTGESSVSLLDPYVYNIFLGQSAYLPLEEVLGEKPEYALDDYSVRLADTPFGEYFDALDVLPEDTVICFRKPTELSSAKEAKEQYEFDKKLFQAIFTFTPPEL